MSPLIDPVPVALLQTAFEQSHMTVRELADRLEWYNSKGGPDITRMNRALGIYPEQNGGDHSSNKKRVETSYENAVMIIRAMGFAPVEFDL